MHGKVSTTLKLSAVLWRTRGFDWDYGFLLEPAAPASFGWYRVQQAIFDGCQPTAETKYLIGALFDGSKAKKSFVAAAFLDPSREDEYGRQIAHYVVWFRKGTNPVDLLDATPIGWEREFLRHISAAFGSTEVFGSPDPSPKGEESPAAHRALKKHLRHIERTIVVSGNPLTASSCLNVGDITIAEDKKQNETAAEELRGQTRFKQRAQIAHPTNLTAEISAAVNSGEAWALMHDASLIQKYLPTLRVGRELMFGGDEAGTHRELASRILKSFSGSADDDFIKARLKDTRMRYVQSLAKVECVKGFDAIVTCLLNAGFHEVLSGLKDEEACTRLASTIGHGASPEDRFIRNVVMRLRTAEGS
jgi:hypothetical protein